MQNIDEFGIKAIDAKTVAGLVLLSPAILWWAGLAVSLAAVSGLGEFLGSSVTQVVILVVFPLAAVIFSLGGAKHSKLRWMVALAGVFLAAMAILASLRQS